MQKTLTSAALEGTRWNYAGFLSRAVAGLVVGTVLARLLGPHPFGQIGVASIIYGLGNLIADAGFSSALVQAPDLQQRQIRAVFTMQVFVGCVMTTIVWLIAPAVGSTFHDAGVVPVVRAISPLFILQSAGLTATGLMKRKMSFRPVQTAQISSYLIGYAFVGVTMAYAGYGVWSLVAAQLVQPLLYSCMMYVNLRHSVRPYFDRSCLRLLRFGAQVTGANVINWTISNLDNVLVGRTFGSTTLGLYSRSFNLANVPVDGFVNACQQVLFASCSRVDLRFDRMRRAYLATLAGVALVTMPVFWSMAVAARFVIVGMYGPRWSEAVPLFASFCVAMPFFALMAIAGPVLGAADRVDQEIRTQAASLLVTIVVFVAAAQVSLLAIALAVPVVYAFRFWCTTRPALLLLSLRWRDIAAVLAGPVCAAAFTAACVFGASRLGNTTQAAAISLAKSAVVGLLSLTVIAYIGGNRIVPSVFAAPLLARAANVPGWLARLLQPFTVPPESGLPPAV